MTNNKEDNFIIIRPESSPVIYENKYPNKKLISISKTFFNIHPKTIDFLKLSKERQVLLAFDEEDIYFCVIPELSNARGYKLMINTNNSKNLVFNSKNIRRLKSNIVGIYEIIDNDYITKNDIDWYKLNKLKG